MVPHGNNGLLLSSSFSTTPGSARVEVRRSHMRLLVSPAAILRMRRMICPSGFSAANRSSTAPASPADRSLAYPVTHFGIQLRRRFFAVIERHVGIDGLAFDVMRIPPPLRRFWVRHQRRFVSAVPDGVRRRSDVIHPAGDPVIAIFIDARRRQQSTYFESGSRFAQSAHGRRTGYAW